MGTVDGGRAGNRTHGICKYVEYTFESGDQKPKGRLVCNCLNSSSNLHPSPLLNQFPIKIQLGKLVLLQRV